MGGREGLSVVGQELVGALLARAEPVSSSRAKALGFAAGRVVGFCEQHGVALEAQVVLSVAVIERLLLEGMGDLSPASRRTVRSNLRALARAGERYPPPPPVALARERAKAPYTPAEIEGYLRLAGAQGTLARRMRTTAMVCLGAGAGIITSELRHLHGCEVIAREGGVIVRLGGGRARSVPVLARYQQPLLAAAAFAGERLICGGQETGRRNLSDTLCAALSTDSSLPRLQAGRLRSTWLVCCAQQIGLGAFMQAAGIHCSQRLGDLAALLAAASEQELITRLGRG